VALGGGPGTGECRKGGGERVNSLLIEDRTRERRPPTEAVPRREDVQRPGFDGVIGATGAIIVVGLGLAFVFVIAVVSLGTVPDSQKAAVVTAAFTVLGTIVGAYFGVKVGSANREQAESARDAEALKVQELTARMDPETAEAALDKAHARVNAAWAGGRRRL
jgi:hypothetical protein